MEDLPVPEEIQGLLSALQEFKPVVNEQKFFVYYNEEKRIICISPGIQNDFRHLGYAIFDLNEVEGFLLGEKNPSDYVLHQSQDDLSDFRIIEKKQEITYMVTLNRFLIEIDEGKKKDPHVLISNDTQNKLITIDISDELRKKLQEDADFVEFENVSIDGETDLNFFFTTKDNSNFLIKHIRVPIYRLIDRKVYTEYSVDLLNTSLFTKQVLNKYQYLVI